MGEGDHERGLQEFLKVLEMPEINKSQFRLVLLNSLLQVALEYEGMKNFDEALWYCQEFIKEDPTYREPYLLMGEMYNIMKMYTLAESCVKAALEYGYQHYSWVERATTFLGWADDVLSVAQFNLGKYKEAVDSVDRAVAHSPNDLRLLKNQNLFLQTYLRKITASQQ